MKPWQDIHRLISEIKKITGKELVMKKLYAVILSSAILASSINAASLAAGVEYVSPADVSLVKIVEDSSDEKPVSITIVDKEASMAEPTSANMEKALLAVKSKIEIPSEYSDFSYEFYGSSSYSNASWRFIWTNPSNYADIQVNCDINNHIIYYYKYVPAKETGIASFLKTELKSKADEFIRKIAPELKGNYELVSTDYEGVYSGNYVYKYQRVENGIAFPDNVIEVSISSITGEVKSISINWLYDKSVPSSETKITKEDAAKLIKENMKMKLVYRQDYVGIYDKNGNRKTKAFLVYEPSQDYISIDAKTGEVYNKKSEWFTVSTKLKADVTFDQANMETADGSATVILTDKEIEKIQELNKLITKEKAIEAITSNASLYLDDTLKSITASLGKISDSKGESSYVWYIDMSDPREIDYSKDDDYYRAYAHAVVDAKSGKIISFYASMKSYFNQKDKKWDTVDIKYNKEQAKSILEKFLKSQISSKFNNSILANSYDDYVLYFTEANKPVYGGYSFSYNRTNEGIEYPYNYIYGSVDGITGKIYNYGYYWNDNIEFESPKGVISPEEAMEYYLKNDGFKLIYEINSVNLYYESSENIEDYIINPKTYFVDYDIRLVYRPDVYPKYISPFTGEQINANGTVYKEKTSYVYSDITDPVLYRNIFLLADMEIGFEGDSFLPNKAVTVGELNKLLSDIGFGYYSNKEDSTDNSTVTREKAAMTFINKLGLENVAKIKGIYKTGFNDEININSDYIGAVALAKGLGLMGADSNNNFNPQKEITRLEAVDLIINFINIERARVYN